MSESNPISSENFSQQAPSPRVAASDFSGAPRITLHIEELVLHGAAPGDRHRIADVVQAELHRMISDQGVPAWAATSVSAPRLEAGPGSVALSSGPSAFGAGVARSIYEATAEESPSP